MQRKNLRKTDYYKEYIFLQFQTPTTQSLNELYWQCLLYISIIYYLTFYKSHQLAHWISYITLM
jgi:hypothetical protein